MSFGRINTAMPCINACRLPVFRLFGNSCFGAELKLLGETEQRRRL